MHVYIPIFTLLLLSMPVAFAVYRSKPGREDENGFHEDPEETFNGERMTVEEFRSCVQCGLFTPDDGIGHWAHGTKETNDTSVFSRLHNPPEGYTHVVWYNK